MPKITVTTTIKTLFEVPEGVPIELVRHQALPNLSDDEDATDCVLARQSCALNFVYMGDADPEACSVEHNIVEGYV